MRATVSASSSTAARSRARPSRACCSPTSCATTLGLTGTHVGCEHGVCGACTVEIDGAPARACLTLAVQADGATIRTVEGLAPEPGRLSVLQEAFRRHHALQCGFCTAGILMSLDYYLRASPRSGRSGAARISRRTSVPLHRLRADRRSGARRRRGTPRGGRACLISAPVSSPAWRATRTRSRSSTATMRLTYAAMVSRAFQAWSRRSMSSG